MSPSTMVRGAIIVAALAQTAFALHGTHPIVAWSSHNSDVLTSVSKSAHTGAFLQSLLSDPSICDHDAIVLVEQMGLHASDLRSLPSSSKVARSINSAPASIELPYMQHSTENPFLDIAGAIAERCGSRMLSVSTGEVGPHIEEASDKKHVVCMGMAPLDGVSDSRKQFMAEQESRLSSDLEKITSAFSKHLIVLAGWNPLLQSRQEFEDDGSALEFIAPPSNASPSKAAAPTGGVLKRYQLLTPGLILSLFVAFFVLVPVVYLGISSLASIQSPVRLDAPKGFSASEKKNQ